MARTFGLGYLRLVTSLLFLVGAPSVFAANWQPNLLVGTIQGEEGSSGRCDFVVNQSVPNTCTYYTAQFSFDATTPKGKNILAMPLLAKAMGKDIAVTYSSSSTPGTNETNGCTQATLANVEAIGFN